MLHCRKHEGVGAAALRKHGVVRLSSGRFEAPRCRSLGSNGAARLPSAKGPAATHLSREARSSFRRPSMATEIGSPPIHGPLPRFPLAVEPPHQDLIAPRLRMCPESRALNNSAPVLRRSRHPCESRDPDRSRAIPACAGMTGALQLLRCTAVG